MKALFSKIENGESISSGTLLDHLAALFPLINEMETTPQDSEWHAEGNVRIHTEMVVDEAFRVVNSEEGTDLNAKERLILILGAVLHDIGKTLTTRESVVNGKTRIISPRHPERGRSYLAPRMPLLELPLDISDSILGLVGYHHDPGKLVVRGEPLRKFSQLARSVDFKLVYLLELADLRGRIVQGDADDRDGFEMMELFRQTSIESGLWTERSRLYLDWRKRIFDQIPSESEAQYTYSKAIREYETGRIFTPEEAIARNFEWRSNHPEIIVMCGVSGSGKSTWIEENCDGYERISLDEIRRQITGKAEDQSKNGEVLQAAKSQLRQHLRDKKRIVWDATTLRKDGRAMVIDLAHDYHASSKIVSLPCPPEWIKSQSKGRDRRVAENIITRQFERLQWPEIWEADVVETALQ